MKHLMNISSRLPLRLLHIWLFSFVLTASAGAQILETPMGKLGYKGGYPTVETSQKLYDELDYQRGIQAYLWALPMASYGAMADEHRRLGADAYSVLLTANLAQPNQLALTANQDTIYLSGIFDLGDGPMVMDLPAGLLGTLNNIWQQPLADLGGPFSPEQNRGGRFLILPPGYDGPMPAAHHHVVQSDTNTVVFYLRAVPEKLSDLPNLVEDMKAYRQYRLSDAASPGKMHFIMTDDDANFLTNEGFAYFEALARYVNDNPPRSEDMAMLGILESLGIAHGQEFKPDARMKGILTEAAKVGRAMAKTLAWAPRIAPDLLLVFPGKRHWKNIFFGNPIFHTADYMAIDQRAKYAFEAIGTAKSMVLAAPGQGSQYAGVYQDTKGRWLSGDKAYRIRLPKNVPARAFWSLTVYDNETRSLIDNKDGRPIVGSLHGAKAERNGSWDLYFAPELPKGVARENWVQTNRGEGWFVYLRLYGPEQSWFDKTWMPGDPKRIN